MLLEMAKKKCSPFNVTGDADVVKMLLATYGNDGEREYFFIPSKDGSSVTNREAFYAKRQKELLEKIKNTPSETNVLDVSSLDVNKDSLLQLCRQLNQKDGKWNLSVTTGFDTKTAYFVSKP